MELAQLTAEQSVLLGAVVVGLTELINRLRASDYWVVATIVTAGLSGGFLGLYWGLDFVTGMLAGVAATGAVKFVGSFGRSSTPQPSTVTTKG